MLALDRQRRYYCYIGISDMRKGFNPLSGMVRSELGQDPISGDIFIFFNRRRTQLKLLSCEQDGFAVYYKCLEKGTYDLPKSDENPMSAAILQCILSGISIKDIKHRKRHAQSNVNVNK